MNITHFIIDKAKYFLRNYILTIQLFKTINIFWEINIVFT